MTNLSLPFETLISKGWIEVPNYLSSALTNALLDRVISFENIGALRPAGIRSEAKVVGSIRGDEIRWIEDWGLEYMKAIHSILTALGETLRFELRVPLKSFEAHFSRYGEGAFYKKHIDQHLDQKHRQVTFVLYLNSCDGGELAIYDSKNRNQIDSLITPAPGKLVLFLSGKIFHEVRASHSTRYGLTGWYRDDLDLEGKTNLAV